MICSPDFVSQLTLSAEQIYVHVLPKHVNAQAWENQSLGESDIHMDKMYLYDKYVQQWRRNINELAAHLKIQSQLNIYTICYIIYVTSS